MNYFIEINTVKYPLFLTNNETPEYEYSNSDYQNIDNKTKDSVSKEITAILTPELKKALYYPNLITSQNKIRQSSIQEVKLFEEDFNSMTGLIKIIDTPVKNGVDTIIFKVISNSYDWRYLLTGYKLKDILLNWNYYNHIYNEASIRKSWNLKDSRPDFYRCQVIGDGITGFCDVLNIYNNVIINATGSPAWEVVSIYKKGTIFDPPVQVIVTGTQPPPTGFKQSYSLNQLTAPSTIDDCYMYVLPQILANAAVYSGTDYLVTTSVPLKLDVTNTFYDTATNTPGQIIKQVIDEYNFIWDGGTTTGAIYIYIEQDDSYAYHYPLMQLGELTSKDFSEQFSLPILKTEYFVLHFRPKYILEDLFRNIGYKLLSDNIKSNSFSELIETSNNQEINDNILKPLRACAMMGSSKTFDTFWNKINGTNANSQSIDLSWANAFQQYLGLYWDGLYDNGGNVDVANNVYIVPLENGYNFTVKLKLKTGIATTPSQVTGITWDYTDQHNETFVGGMWDEYVTEYVEITLAETSPGVGLGTVKDKNGTTLDTFPFNSAVTAQMPQAQYMNNHPTDCISIHTLPTSYPVTFNIGFEHNQEIYCPTEFDVEMYKQVNGAGAITLVEVQNIKLAERVTEYTNDEITFNTHLFDANDWISFKLSIADNPAGSFIVTGISNPIGANQVYSPAGFYNGYPYYISAGNDYIIFRTWDSLAFGAYGYAHELCLGNAIPVTLPSDRVKYTLNGWFTMMGTYTGTLLIYNNLDKSCHIDHTYTRIIVEPEKYLTRGQTVIIPDYLPDEYCIDYIKKFANEFNFRFDTNPENKTVRIEPRDTFYLNETIDISNPEFINKEIEISKKEISDQINKSIIFESALDDLDVANTNLVVTGITDIAKKEVTNSNNFVTGETKITSKYPVTASYTFTEIGFDTTTLPKIVKQQTKGGVMPEIYKNFKQRLLHNIGLKLADNNEHFCLEGDQYFNTVWDSATDLVTIVYALGSTPNFKTGDIAVIVSYDVLPASIDYTNDYLTHKKFYLVEVSVNVFSLTDISGTPFVIGGSGVYNMVVSIARANYPLNVYYCEEAGNKISLQWDDIAAVGGTIKGRYQKNYYNEINTYLSSHLIELGMILKRNFYYKLLNNEGFRKQYLININNEKIIARIDSIVNSGYESQCKFIENTDRMLTQTTDYIQLSCTYDSPSDSIELLTTMKAIRGTGNLYLYDSSDNLVDTYDINTLHTIPATVGEVTLTDVTSGGLFDNTNIVIYTGALASDTYYILHDAGIVKDFNGIDIRQQTDKTALTFTI